MHDEIRGHSVQQQGVLLLIFIWYGALIHKGGCIGEVRYPSWMFMSFTCPAGCFKYPSGVYSSYSIYSSPVLLKSWSIQRRRIRESQTTMKCHGMLNNGPQKLSLGLYLWNANEKLIVIFGARVTREWC